MKKLILIFSIVLLSLVGSSQQAKVDEWFVMNIEDVETATYSSGVTYFDGIYYQELMSVIHVISHKTNGPAVVVNILDENGDLVLPGKGPHWIITSSKNELGLQSAVEDKIIFVYESGFLLTRTFLTSSSVKFVIAGQGPNSFIFTIPTEGFYKVYSMIRK